MKVDRRKKIILIQKPSLLREGMVMVLRKSFQDYEIEAYGKENALTFECADEKADVLILDLDMDNEISACINFFKNASHKVIVWTSRLHKELLFDAFKWNMNGYFFNEMEEAELLSAVRTVISGKTYIHASFLPLLLDDYGRLEKEVNKAKTPAKPEGLLSLREWEVLELLADGLSNEEIAASLQLSSKTVKNHVTSILRKMGVNNRIRAVVTALKNEWIFLK